MNLANTSQLPIEWLPDLPPRVPLEPGDAQRRLLEAITRVLLALEQVVPHLLILDDLRVSAGTRQLLTIPDCRLRRRYDKSSRVAWRG